MKSPSKRLIYIINTILSGCFAKIGENYPLAVLRIWPPSKKVNVILGRFAGSGKTPGKSLRVSKRFSDTKEKSKAVISLTHCFIGG